MRVSRYEALMRDLPVALRKVYECVPAQEAWNISAICSEMARQGLTRDRRAITGCLDRLVRDGLIREVSQGDFQRVVLPQPAPLALVQASPSPETTAMSSPTAKALSHMDLMAALAERARAISADLVRFAEDIEAVAVRIDEDIVAAGKDTSKLRQLQTLLKELT